MPCLQPELIPFFRAYGGMGRLNKAESWDEIKLAAIAHMVVFVQIPGDVSNKTYLIDIGIGIGPPRPIPLEEGVEVAGTTSPEKYRLVRAQHPHSALAPDASLEWRLQTNITRNWELLPGDGWRTLHQFGTQEFFLSDFEAFSWAVANRHQGLFHETVLALLFTSNGEEQMLGARVLVGSKVTARYGGKIEVLKELKTEEDRLLALKEYFGIEYSSSSLKHVSERGAALPT